MCLTVGKPMSAITLMYDQWYEHQSNQIFYVWPQKLNDEMQSNPSVHHKRHHKRKSDFLLQWFEPQSNKKYTSIPLLYRSYTTLSFYLCRKVLECKQREREEKGREKERQRRERERERDRDSVQLISTSSFRLKLMMPLKKEY